MLDCLVCSRLFRYYASSQYYQGCCQTNCFVTALQSVATLLHWDSGLEWNWIEKSFSPNFLFLGANSRARVKLEAPCKLQFGGKSNMLQISCHRSSSCQATLHSSCPAGNFHLWNTHKRWQVWLRWSTESPRAQCRGSWNDRSVCKSSCSIARQEQLHNCSTSCCFVEEAMGTCAAAVFLQGQFFLVGSVANVLPWLLSHISNNWYRDTKTTDLCFCLCLSFASDWVNWVLVTKSTPISAPWAPLGQSQPTSSGLQWSSLSSTMWSAMVIGVGQNSIHCSFLPYF